MRGIVIKSTGSLYQVKLDNQLVVECKIKGKFRLEGIKTTNPIAVGDYVDVEVNKNDFSNIIKIHPRRNYIIRKSINLSKQSQIIACNLDQAVLIATLVSPRTSLGFIDRFLITAEAYQIPVKIVFNKKDLLTEVELEMQQEIMELYTSIGYDCYLVSSFDENDITTLRTLFQDKISLVTGHSGVGKSTLVNAIEPDLHIRTGEISDVHSKGKHTTTFAEMHDLEFGGSIIDTPGIKELGLVEMKKEEVAKYFKEFRHFAQDCKFNDCMHVNEPKCAVLKAVEDGEISDYRYHSYLGILNGEEMDWKEWEL